jgi:hypothetical protein
MIQTRIITLWLLLVSGVAFGAGKDYVPGYVLINNVSLASNVTTNPIDTRGWDNIDIELIATGTPNGMFFVDCTLLPTMPPAASAQTWVQIPLVPGPITSGTSTNIVIELNQMGCMFVRVRYTATSGTGALTAYVGEKQI